MKYRKKLTKRAVMQAAAGVLALGISSADSSIAEPARHFPVGTREIYIADQPGVRKDLLANIAPLVEKSIAQGNYPGAVILVSHRGNIIYRGVFGNQRVTPDPVPLKFDTIFDIASLTKVVVTTTAIMQLLEEGKLNLDAPVAQYWPAFAKNGKQAVTIRELMTHTSGFQARLPVWQQPAELNQRYRAGLRQVEELHLANKPGAVFTYSDVNFVTLGYLVEIISGQRLNQYAQTHIFQPLKMTHSTFLPPANWHEQIAPTYSPDDRQARWGEVNDPDTHRMGGVTGVAGVFSNADDLNLFAQCLLNHGRIEGNQYLLGPLTVLKMTTPQTPAGMTEIRGLGWDIDSPYSNGGILFSTSAFGHTGWTGTSLWIDPVTQTSIIILTSRTHPSPLEKSQLTYDRQQIANIVAGSLTDVPTQLLSITGKGELSYAYSKRNSSE